MPTTLFRPALLPLVFLAGVLLGCPPDDGPPDVEAVLGEPGWVPGVIEQTVQEGGPNPETLLLEVTNSGDCELDYALTTSTVDGADWLSVTAAPGTLAPSASADHDIAIDVVSTQLSAGTYTGSIVIEGTCVRNGEAAIGSPLPISVNLTVTPLRAGITVNNDRFEQDIVSLDALTWEMTTRSAAPEPRSFPVMVWTGRRAFVWGGDSSSGAVDTGGLYDPLTDSWTPTTQEGSPSPRVGARAVWTGSEVIVWGGGEGGFGSSLPNGARFDPDTREWRDISGVGAPTAAAYFPSVIWTGAEIVVFGGHPGDQEPVENGGRYDPEADTWSSISFEGAPEPRWNHAAIWTGTHMIVWGGYAGEPASVPSNTGGVYDPETDTWSSMSLVDAPSPRVGPAAVWTGSELIVWGGFDHDDDVTTHDTGGRYDPWTDRWMPIFRDDAPDPTVRQAVWTGSHMMLWVPEAEGGVGGVELYDPVTDGWASGPLSSLTGHQYAGLVWTGRELVVWGDWGTNIGAVLRQSRTD